MNEAAMKIILETGRLLFDKFYTWWLAAPIIQATCQEEESKVRKYGGQTADKQIGFQKACCHDAQHHKRDYLFVRGKFAAK